MMMTNLLRWRLVDITVGLNMVRDLGKTMVAAMFFGRDAFTQHHYAWIGILSTTPASVVGTTLYELLLKDSILHIVKDLASHREGHEGLVLHLSRVGALE